MNAVFWVLALACLIGSFALLAVARRDNHFGWFQLVVIVLVGLWLVFGNTKSLAWDSAPGGARFIALASLLNYAAGWGLWVRRRRSRVP